MPALFLTCAGGAEALLAEEATRIAVQTQGSGREGGRVAEASRGGVWVEGDARTAMALNLESRLAQRVLWPLAEGPYRDEHELYALARTVPWSDWISPEQTLRVDSSAFRSPLKSLNFAALRVKDAVCDALREAAGARPSVDTRHPDLPIALFAGSADRVVPPDKTRDAARLLQERGFPATFTLLRGWNHDYVHGAYLRLHRDVWNGLQSHRLDQAPRFQPILEAP